MLEVGVALGGFPGVIRPKEECIKSYETYFANTLNLNDKGSSMKWVCCSKFYGLLAIWPWLKRSPQNSLNVIYCVIITAWWALRICPIFICKLNPIKAHWGTGSWSFSFERSATFPSQADHVLVDLFSSAVDRGLWGQSPPQKIYKRRMWWLI